MTSKPIKNLFRCSREMLPVTYADTSALERETLDISQSKPADWIKTFAEWYAEFYG